MVNFGACIVKFPFFRHTIYNACSPHGQGRLKRNLNRTVTSASEKRNGFTSVSKLHPCRQLKINLFFCKISENNSK